jgi:hypothetical protein
LNSFDISISFCYSLHSTFQSKHSKRKKYGEKMKNKIKQTQMQRARAGVGAQVLGAVTGSAACRPLHRVIAAEVPGHALRRGLTTSSGAYAAFPVIFILLDI